MKTELLLEIEKKIKSLEPADTEGKHWWSVFKDFVSNLNVRNMPKTFTVDYRDRTQWDKRGVYVIYFGEKFYIGRTKLLCDRKKQHEKAISKHLVNPELITEIDFYYPIISHLLANPEMTTAQIELVEECKTNDELFFGEQRWLTKYENNPFCLNKSFIAKRPYNEKEETVEQCLVKPVVYNNWGKIKYGKRFGERAKK